jgi:hypothetical protein
LDGAAWKLEPFPPSCIEEYEVEETGRTRAVMRKQFYNIGDRPFFKPFIPYDCESFFFKFILHWGKLAFHFIKSDPYPYFLYFSATACKSLSLTSFINSSVINGDSK